LLVFILKHCASHWKLVYQSAWCKINEIMQALFQRESALQFWACSLLGQSISCRMLPCKLLPGLSGSLDMPECVCILLTGIPLMGVHNPCSLQTFYIHLIIFLLTVPSVTFVLATCCLSKNRRKLHQDEKLCIRVMTHFFLRVSCNSRCLV